MGKLHRCLVFLGGGEPTDWLELSEDQSVSQLHPIKQELESAISDERSAGRRHASAAASSFDVEKDDANDVHVNIEGDTTPVLVLLPEFEDAMQVVDVD
ncbi:hypothetical protein T4C_9316 [Trichinella pseudospiralis]|uniref:Uncharacterized protein n=1 Tax=Trichinella pseudospiralis TaxID=6337 RepID=A0A0V1J8A5_TRIPS|nr:hypothetical protein T4C_9316 [Trichinella pseudospiralis]